MMPHREMRFNAGKINIATFANLEWGFFSTL